MYVTHTQLQWIERYYGCCNVHIHIMNIYLNCIFRILYMSKPIICNFCILINDNDSFKLNILFKLDVCISGLETMTVPVWRDFLGNIARIGRFKNNEKV